MNSNLDQENNHISTDYNNIDHRGQDEEEQPLIQIQPNAKIYTFEECTRKVQGIGMADRGQQQQQQPSTESDETAESNLDESYIKDDNGMIQSWLTRSLFQKIIVMVTLLCSNTCNFIILGLPFYKKEPHHFTCKGLDGKWSSCNKAYICSYNLDKSQYQADTDDSQYIQNWVEQTGMLCESKSRLGFLGACFFIGVISASSICPVGYLSDVYGRKWVFVGTMISEIISCYILLTATSLDMLYVGMYIMGLGHPGRFIVSMAYADEFLTQKQKQLLLPYGSIAQGLTVIFCAFYFQNLSRNVMLIQLGNLVFISVLTFYTIVAIPESPKFLYSKGRFDEARNSLAYVARVNNQPFDKRLVIFDTEAQAQDQGNEEQKIGEITDDGSTNEKERCARSGQYYISNRDFAINLAMMCGLFIMASFSFWLIDFQQEFLGTNIYVNFYIAGFVSIISGQGNIWLYEPLGMRTLLQYVQSVMIASCTFIIMVQQKILKFEDPESELYFVNIGIPLALIFLSCACQIGFTGVTQCSYQDERIFPFSKKATAVNCVVLVSKFFSIGVAFVNEMQEPIPILVIVCMSCVALMISFAFPKKSTLDQMTAELKESQKKFKKEAQMALKAEQEKMRSQVKSIQLEKQDLAEEILQEDQNTDKNSADEAEQRSFQ